MEYEKLVLEVSAIKAGLTPVSPHVLQGSSGIQHRFNLLFSDGSHYYAFDFYDSVTEVEVVKSYAKKFDLRCRVNIVCPAGKATQEAVQLALGYNMRILAPEAASSFFTLQRVTSRSSFG
jgi:hypothetical protein